MSDARRGAACVAALAVACGAGLGGLGGCREGNELVITVVAGPGVDGAAVTQLVVEMTRGPGGSTNTSFDVDGELDDGTTSFSIRPGRYRGPLVVEVTAGAGMVVLGTGVVLTEVMGGRQEYEVTLMVSSPTDSGPGDSGGVTTDSAVDGGEAGPVVCSFGAPSPVDELNTPMDERDPHLSPVGLRIWFSTDTGVPVGGRDINTATRMSVADMFLTPVPEPFNTPVDDLGPSLSDDLQTLVFNNNSGATGDHDLFIATRASATLPFTGATPLTGVNMGAGVQDSDPWLSGDGLRLYFSSTRMGGMGGYDLWLATRLSKGGTFSVVGPVLELNSTNHEEGASLSSDEATIVFGRRSTSGSTSDLWIATRAGMTGPFSAPTLIPLVSSSENDLSPFIAYDGSLYFASDRAPPFGGGNFDLYRSPLNCE